jgi:two-component system phosphate regulon sensor histidine kinase PhoR
MDWLLFSETAFDGVLLLDESDRVQHANRAACEIFGIPYPPPTGVMVGQTLLEATHLRALSELCHQSRQAGNIWQTEIRLVGRTERILQVRAAPLPSPTETHASALLLVLSDQTELHRLRTVRTEFVANVSHELRTPLASIRATAETLLDGAMEDPEYGRRFLKTIIREADRLVSLSDDLLELSRAESGQRERKTFDLRVLIADVAARIGGAAERRQVRLQPPRSGEPVTVFADRSEIDQVVFNLLDNAIKYTPEGGRVTLTLDTNKANHTVLFSVEDTGIGILSQDLPRIFERFWRADRARKFANGHGDEKNTATGGTGLGLSIVKHIIEAHGGTVTAQSELGQGSRFTVTLPLSNEGRRS